MLLLISEDTFTAPPTPATSNAVRMSLLSREMGLLRLVVSPTATEAARRHGLDQGLADALDVAQRGWLEGQSLLSQLSRVVRLVDDPARHGAVRGNAYEVATDFASDAGLFREAAVVSENIATDGAYLDFLFRLWSQTDRATLDRLWGVRMDQGGGSAIRNYVARYTGSPEPMTIVCDRDSEGLPRCGDTVKNCVDDIIQHGLFPCRDTAKAGGFSPGAPHFAFEILDAWSIECLVTPHLSELLLTNAMNRVEADARTTLLNANFDSHPALDEANAEKWLATNFKKLHGGNSVWNSNSIQRFIEWASDNEVNQQSTQDAFNKDYQCERFKVAIDKVCSTLITIGVRDKRLM